MLYRMTFTEYFLSRVALVGMLAALVALVGCGSEPGPTSDTEIAFNVPSPPAAVPMPTAGGTVAFAAPQVSSTEPVTFEQAKAVYDAGRFEEAAGLFAEYTALEAENPWGYYMLGLASHKAGDFEAAENALNTAIDLDSVHVKSRLNLVRVMLDTGRPDEALDILEGVFQLEPESGVAYRLQGRAYHQLGDLEGAVAAYREAILIDDTDAWAMNNMALALIEEERFEEALPVAARAVEINDAVSVFQNNLGIALERTHRLADAEGAYRAAVALDAGHERATVNLARVEELDRDSTAETSDMAAFAQEFVRRIAEWRGVTEAVGPQAEEIETADSSQAVLSSVEEPAEGPIALEQVDAHGSPDGRFSDDQRPVVPVLSEDSADASIALGSPEIEEQEEE